MTTTVVVDTNVYISAFIFGGLPRRLLELAEGDAFSVAVSPELKCEVERILENRFAVSRRKIRTLCSPLWKKATTVYPRVILADCRDPKDNHILACAVEAEAEFIVTGDSDLLVMHPFRDIAIVNPTAFLGRKLKV